MSYRDPISAIFDLQDAIVHLSDNGAIRSHANDVGFLQLATANPELMEGYILSLHHAADSAAVHYPTWEMHPEGDELLILLSGSMSTELRQERSQSIELLACQTASIVPAGVWHRLIVHEPSMLIAITPRKGTLLED